jgi:hypothetical protein
MLRLFVLILLLLNSLYFAWSQGFLAELGLAPEQQTEPRRLQQQIRPEALRLLSPQELLDAPAPATSAPECLQAGPFSEAQSTQLRAALASIMPPGSWTLEALKGEAAMLRVPRADGEQRARLNEITAALANQPLSPCQ